MKRKTIFPRNYFQYKKEYETVDEAMSKEVGFWDDLAKKSEISDPQAVFVCFTLLNNRIIFNWFKGKGNTKSLYDYVTYVGNIKEKFVIYKGKDKIDNNVSIDSLYNQSNQRKRLELVVRRN